MASPPWAAVKGKGGLLYDRFGFQALILANLGVVVALVIILFTVKEPSLAERDR